MRKFMLFLTVLVALLGIAFDNEMEHTNKIRGHSKSMYALNSSSLDPFFLLYTFIHFSGTPSVGTFKTIFSVSEFKSVLANFSQLKETLRL